MPEVIIKYEKPETLKALKSLGKLLGFSISSSSVKKQTEMSFEERFKDIIVPGDPSADLQPLREIFTGRNIDAKELRKKAWERKR